VVLEFQGERAARYELETNKKGRFMKVGLQPGPYRFTASKEGYRSTWVEGEVTLGGRSRAPDIELVSSEEIAQARGDAANTKFAQAVALASDEKYDEAEVLLIELRDEVPTVPEIHLNLAYIYAKQQDWANAEASFLKTLELRPGDPHATVGLSGVYADTGRDAEAQVLVSQAARENPGDAAAQFNYAVSLLNSGKAEEAIASFEAALAADDTLAEAHFHLGTLLLGQGNAPEALQHLETYLSMNPTQEQNVAAANELIAALKK
jgi:tetratricopeptide (TPR) repeat protein